VTKHGPAPSSWCDRYQAQLVWETIVNAFDLWAFAPYTYRSTLILNSFNVCWENTRRKYPNVCWENTLRQCPTLAEKIPRQWKCAFLDNVWIGAWDVWIGIPRQWKCAFLDNVWIGALDVWIGIPRQWKCAFLDNVWIGAWDVWIGIPRQWKCASLDNVWVGALDVWIGQVIESVFGQLCELGSCVNWVGELGSFVNWAGYWVGENALSLSMSELGRLLSRWKCAFLDNVWIGALDVWIGQVIELVFGQLCELGSCVNWVGELGSCVNWAGYWVGENALSLTMCELGRLLSRWNCAFLDNVWIGALNVWIGQVIESVKLRFPWQCVNWCIGCVNWAGYW
jgi:hypothetical protein